MLIFLWVLSIIISFFIGRKIVELVGYEFVGDTGLVFLFILAGVVPFINIIIYLIIWVVVICEESDFNQEDFLKKIFRVKGE